MIFVAGCAKEPQNRVVLYCSVDDVYARPIIAELEKQTGLQIEALYDVEAAKTAGLANRIRAEKARPRADVFWSSALLQTLLLQREGLLQEYSSRSAQGIPAAFKDKSGGWTGMGVRSRVLMFRREAGKSFVPGAKELVAPRWKNKIAISNPQFGTGSDWAAALATRWGKAHTLEYFRTLKKNGARVLPGNSVVAEKVARGELMMGVTDSDDFLVFARKAKPNEVMARGFDHESGGVLIPGSVAMIKGAPNPENARKLTDALLSAAIERRLAAQMPGVVATRDFTSKKISSDLNLLFAPPERVPDDTARWAKSWDEIREPLAQTLLSD